MFYNYEEKTYKTDREVKEWELSQVRKCDIMIVNLDCVNDSVGTHFELSIAESVNSSGSKPIYIVGVGNGEQLHPWIKESLFRIEESYDDAAEYIANYLLV